MSWKKYWLVVVWCVFFLISGCWDLLEIETATLPPAYGFGVDEEDPTKFRFFMEYYPIREEEKKLVYSATRAHTVQEGINYFQKRIGGKIKNAYLGALIFEEKVAEKGLNHYLDYFWRDPGSSGGIVIAVTEGKIDDIFKSKVAMDYGIGIRLGDIITNNGPASFQIPTQTLLEFYNKTVSKGIDPYLPYLRVGEEEFGIIGVALFRKGKMIGFLDEELTQALLITRKATSTGRLFDEEKYQSAFNIRLDDVRILPRWSEDQLNAKIDVRMTAFITELLGDESVLLDEQRIKEIEAELSSQTTNLIKRLMEQLQYKYQVDPVGIGKVFQARYPKAFQKINWEEVYPKVKYEINVETRIRIFGTTF